MRQYICLEKNWWTGRFEILLDFDTKEEALADMKEWAEEFVFEHRRNPIPGKDYLIVERIPDVEARFDLDHVWEELNDVVGGAA